MCNSVDGRHVCRKAKSSDFTGQIQFSSKFLEVLLGQLALWPSSLNDKTSRPEYNQILVKKPGGTEFWP
ncbi:hypothetical protein Lal_00038496 [Lupinus albus]|nr:hypothetical protein Lal_00038496 [Lupinus albus]